MSKKKNLCIICGEPYDRNKGWASQSGLMWDEGQTEEDAVPYKVYWHGTCQAKQEAEYNNGLSK